MQTFQEMPEFWLIMLVCLVTGLAVSTIARFIFPTKVPRGYIGLSIVGITGSIVGAYMATLLGFGGITGFDLRSLIINTIGAVLSLGVYSFAVKRSQKSLEAGSQRNGDLRGQGQIDKRPVQGREHTRKPDSERRAKQGKVIFISYRRSDSADITGRMYDRLEARFGRTNVFKDVDSIPLGVDFRQHLDSVVSACSVLIAIIGRSWLGQEADNSFQSRLHDPRDFVRIEIETALKRNIPVIPVLVQGATMPDEGSLPPALQELRYRNWIAVRPDPDFHKDMERLIGGLEAHLN